MLTGLFHTFTYQIVCTMKRNTLVLLLFTGWLFTACTPVVETGNVKSEIPDLTFDFRPNILWLVAEDMSPYIPAFGDSTIRTPNLSRLAEEGIRYTNVYSPSGVCAPSRFALATSVYPTSAGAHNMRTGTAYLDSLGLISYEVVTPPEVRMMSEIMRMNGYYCTNNAKTDYQFAQTVTAWDESGIRAHWRHRPERMSFFSIFNFVITHESQFFGPPMKINLRYNHDFPDGVKNFRWGERIDSSEWVMNVPADLDVPVPPYLPDVEAVRNDIRVMYSNIIEMDKQVGIILRQLEEDDLLDNTIIVWFTDHGGPLPRQKRLMYDAGIKVPMIIRYPDGRGAGRIDDQLISFIDFAPTTFSFAGIKPPEFVEGQAFAGEYKASEPRNYIHAGVDRLDGYYDMIRATRDKRFKYLLNLNPELGYYLPLDYRERITTMQVLLKMKEDQQLNETQNQWFRESKPEEELFDTWNDPHEIHNLADNPGYREKLEELRNECRRWMDAVDDKGLVPEADLIEGFWPGGLQPETSPPEIVITGSQIILRSGTPGASIGYRILGRNESPDGRWEVYQGPLNNPHQPGKKLYVIADRIGYKASLVKSTDL